MNSFQMQPRVGSSLPEGKTVNIRRIMKRNSNKQCPYISTTHRSIDRIMQLEALTKEKTEIQGVEISPGVGIF